MMSRDVFSAMLKFSSDDFANASISFVCSLKTAPVLAVCSCKLPAATALAPSPAIANAENGFAAFPAFSKPSLILPILLAVFSAFSAISSSFLLTCSMFPGVSSFSCFSVASSDRLTTCNCASVLPISLSNFCHSAVPILSSPKSFCFLRNSSIFLLPISICC